MLFNSLEFLIFLVIVFFIYWKLGHKAQNVFLVLASLVFYGWWDWRFLFLILISCLVDYYAGLKIQQSQNSRKRKIYLWLSLGTNLAILGFFKYFNFFIGSLQAGLTSLGIPPLSLGTLNVILPVGISFYTFQAMSYAIEVYQRKIEPEKNIINYLGFVSFFPQLVAGPIERASHLLGQFSAPRKFDRSLAVEGIRQIIWGLFKKIVIADGLAMVINQVYANVYDFNGTMLLIATFFFAFQIYCDFSGYSDIAIGTARLFGFNLMRNFAYPYFSRSIVEFWSRWHISLSTWFKDYVFIPLGGSRVFSKFKYARNILITFVLSGLWHGANWTYIIWGFLHGFYYLPYIFREQKVFRYREDKPDEQAKLRELPQIVTTFLLVMFAWIFFRAADFNQAVYIIKKIIIELPRFDFNLVQPKQLILIAALLVIEWWQRLQPHPLKVMERAPAYLRPIIYYALALIILLLGSFAYTPFIYFQF